MTCNQENNTSKPVDDSEAGIHRHTKIVITDIVNKIEEKMYKMDKNMNLNIETESLKTTK